MKAAMRKKIFDVSGEGQVNNDGTSRQEIIAESYPGDIVSLIREPENPYDENAIRIDYKGAAIGYVNKKDAVQLALAIDASRQYYAIIHKLKGGVPDYPNYGVEISISWDDRPEHPYVELDEAQEKFREKLEKSSGCLGVIIFFFLVSVVINVGDFAFV